jgi:hypothetical protein
MKSLNISLIALFFLTASALYSQDSRTSKDDRTSKEDRSLLIGNDRDGKFIITNPDVKYTTNSEDSPLGEYIPDYKIISSNTSYIEIEYYLQGLTARPVEFNGERLATYEFSLGMGKDLNYSGSPDLRFRAFGIMLPSNRNNSVQVIDYDMKEEKNVNITPIPQMYFSNPNVRNFESLIYTYNKGP